MALRTPSARGPRRASLLGLALLASSGAALAQPAPAQPAPAQPAPAPTAPAQPTPPDASPPAPPATDTPTTGDAPAAPPIPDAPTVPDPTDPAAMTPADVADTGILRLHIITTRNTYATMGFDIYNTSTQELVASGTGADEAIGQVAPAIDLAPGVYKIVRARQGVGTQTDYATVKITAGEELDYVIVVEPDTLHFRGSGVVSGQLPTGTTIAGIRVALNGGGSLNFTHRHKAVGGTSGLSGVAALYGNFSLVYDRGPHFLSVTSDLAITLQDQASASIASTQDRWEAAALYAYNLGNPYIGPYARASFSTRVTPGYLYLLGDEGDDAVTVTFIEDDGNTVTQTYGTEANQDDLRVQVAKAFSPIILQEEIGANLKAASLDLLLLKLTVATRLGFGFRQGITNDLLVVQGEDDDGSAITLREIDDYNTLGPVVGANATVTFARWLFGAGSFGMMIPVKDTDAAGPDFGRRLLIDMAGTAGLKLPPLTSFLFASFDYTFRLQKDGYLTRGVQFDQTLMARLNVSLF